MADKSKIDWTDATTNPIRARNRATGKLGWHCEHVSPACQNCYAETQNKAGFAGGTRLPYKPGHRDDVEFFLDENTLTQPFRWKRGRKIFVCSMTDLFADFVPDVWIDKVFAVMALAPQHTYQVLTKRSARMREYMARRSGKHHPAMVYAACLSATGTVSHPAIDLTAWPLANVWLGVTAEDQERADQRIPNLLATPAAKRFVSYEPALGPIDWKRWLPTKRPAKRADGTAFLAPHFFMTRCEHCGWTGSSELCGTDSFGDDGDVFCPVCQKSMVADELPDLDWVIAGGESGPHARPAHPDWLRSLRDQCAAAGAPLFFKQWGELAPICAMGEPEIDACYHPAPKHKPEADRRLKVAACVMTAGGLHASIGESGSYHTVPANAFKNPTSMTFFRVGKRRAGHLLDGREHRAFPA